MLIVPDTNVLFADSLLKGADAIAVKNAAERLGYRLMLPKVVFDEAIQKRREQTEEAVGKLRAALGDLNRLGIKQHTAAPGEGDVNKAVAKYTTHLSELFPNDGLLPYPEETHRTVAARAVSKRRPFTERDKGYRDTLIWLTVIAVLKDSDEPVSLVSGDSGFRKSRESNELHQDLLKDLEAAHIAPDRVTLYRDMGQFMGHFVVPQLESLDEVKSAIEANAIPSLGDLEDQVGILLNESILQVSVGSYKELDFFDVDVIEDVVLEEAIEVRRLPGGEVFARTVWTCDITPDTGTSAYSYNPYMQYADSGSRYVPARATIDLVLDPSAQDVIAMDIAEFEVDY